MLKTVILSLLCLCAAASIASPVVMMYGAVGIRYFVMPHLLSVWTAVITTWWLARSSASPRMKILAATCIGLWIVWKVRTDRKEAKDEEERERERSEMYWGFRSRMIVAEDKLIVAEEKLAKLAK
jgi:hypothetical protein